MKRLKAFLPLTLVALSLPGCVFASFTTPLDTDLQNTDLGSKRGEASLQSVAWLVGWGDAGTKAAADAGGIKTVTHADTHFLSILGGLFYKQTTIVYGD